MIKTDAEVFAQVRAKYLEKPAVDAHIVAAVWEIMSYFEPLVAREGLEYITSTLENVVLEIQEVRQSLLETRLIGSDLFIQVVGILSVCTGRTMDDLAPSARAWPDETDEDVYFRTLDRLQEEFGLKFSDVFEQELSEGTVIDLVVRVDRLVREKNKGE